MLHTIRKPWKLRYEDCPCDVDFVAWLRAEDVRGSAIFHFGSGSHHHVGLACAGDRQHNAVLAVTATPKEYDAFVKISRAQPELGKRYAVQFGDIYTLNPLLLPRFDVVTLFHLCEFRDERNDAYGALTDRELLDIFAERLNPGGRMLFYPGSYAFDRAGPLIEEWASASGFVEVGAFRSVKIFQRALKASHAAERHGPTT